MTEKRTFREAVERAINEAAKLDFPTVRVPPFAFLKALEAQGATILWGEPTEAMIEATMGFPIEKRVRCAIAAAPTVTDLMGDER